MSIFNNPSWLAQASSSSDDDEEDTGSKLFSHSNNYFDVAKEKIERKNRQVEKAKVQVERRKVKTKRKERKTSVERESEETVEHSPKRIDSGEGKKLLAKATAGFFNISDSEDDETPTSTPTSEVRRSSRSQPTKDVSSPVKKPKSRLKTPVAVTVVDDDEDNLEISEVVERTTAPPPPPEEDEDSDPELAAIKRRARERRKVQQQNAASNGSSLSPAFWNGSEQLPTPPPSDPVVQILVTSEIPNSNALIVCRKISQNLDPVREAWIKRQGSVISPMVASEIFFTHRGKRIFNTTLVKRLGVAVDPFGKAYLEDDPNADGAAKVHVEAVTPEIFHRQESDRAHAAAKASNLTENESVGQGDEGVDVSQSAPKQQIRITVKAKDKAPFKIIVFPDTVVSKILKGARKKMGFDESQRLYLEFDGERLNPEDQVGNTEIEDMVGLDLFLGG